MSWMVSRSEKSRHFVLRASTGEVIPEALTVMLRNERIVAGWLRGSGMLDDVELRVFDTAVAAFGSARRIVGPVQLLTLEGSIGLLDGEPSTSLRAVMARQTDRGLETLAGEIARARAIALEVFITSLDDVVLERSIDDAAAGLSLVRPSTEATARSADARAGGGRPAATHWSAAVDASDRPDRDARGRSPGGAPAVTAPMPLRPLRAAGAAGAEGDGPLPETGDLVDHFAFGLCEVLKTDGDRIHLRVGKEGRVREIAMEMLRVSRLSDTEDGKHRFKLERRM